MIKKKDVDLLYTRKIIESMKNDYKEWRFNGSTYYSPYYNGVMFSIFYDTIYAETPIREWWMPFYIQYNIFSKNFWVFRKYFNNMKKYHKHKLEQKIFEELENAINKS